MSNPIKPKRNYSPGVTPLETELEVHECAVNWADNKLFVKREDGTIQSVLIGDSGTFTGTVDGGEYA